MLGKFGKPLRLTNGFDEHADRRHTIIGNEVFEYVLGSGGRLIAHGDEVGEGQSAVGKREVETHVAALGDDPHPFRQGSATMLVGP